LYSFRFFGYDAYVYGSFVSSWKAHVEAAVSGSTILAGVVLKLDVELQFHPDPAARKLSTNLCDIYHC
jgi:hypothetical protein